MHVNKSILQSVDKPKSRRELNGITGFDEAKRQTERERKSNTRRAFPRCSKRVQDHHRVEAHKY